MRQHAHQMRRPRRWRRLGVVLAASLALVAAAALVWRAPTPTSAGGIEAALSTTTGGSTAPSPSSAASAGQGILAGQATAGASAPMPTIPDTGGSAGAGSPSPSPSPHSPDHADLVPGTPAPPSTLTGYVWPIAHPRLTLPFGPTAWGTRLVDGRLFHDGLDLATFCNDRIMAAHDGIVMAAGRHFDDDIGWVGSLAAYYQRINAQHLWLDLPNVVIVDDGNGYRSIYAHMWKLTVRAGQHVKAGQLIGYEGMTGHATGCHLHYGLFSPAETATFLTEPKAIKTWHEPPAEIARIDPLLVLPYRKGLGGVQPAATSAPSPG